MSESPRFLKAASEPGGTATLVCRASGDPLLAFQWHTADGTPVAQAQRLAHRHRLDEPRVS